MSDFIILTDSSIDLPAEIVQELGISVLPLHFTIGNQTYSNYPDNRDMELHVFYNHLRAGELATTSAVNVGDYTSFLIPVMESGRDVLILAFSSGLSATYNSACVAAAEIREKYPERKIIVVDTLCASMGQGLLVWRAVEEYRNGKSMEELRDWVMENRLQVCHHFTVDDLHFLKRGGRISAATAVVGSMLQIKPLLHVDNEGHLVNVGKSRGRNASLKALVDRMEQTAIHPETQRVLISHGDCLNDAETVAQMIRDRFGTKEIYLNYVGPVIGAHTGPGLVALFYIGTER